MGFLQTFQVLLRGAPPAPLPTHCRTGEGAPGQPRVNPGSTLRRRCGRRLAQPCDQPGDTAFEVG